MEKHFLIAEDDADDVELFKEAIKRTGLPIKHTTVIYCEGIFTSIADELLPHVIIVDGKLPRMSFLECINAIRSHERLGRSPIVIVSGFIYAPAQQKGYEAGVNLYTEKPSSFETLKEFFKRLYYIEWSSYPYISSDHFYSLDLY